MQCSQTASGRARGTRCLAGKQQTKRYSILFIYVFIYVFMHLCIYVFADLFRQPSPGL